MYGALSLMKALRLTRVRWLDNVYGFHFGVAIIKSRTRHYALPTFSSSSIHFLACGHALAWFLLLYELVNWVESLVELRWPDQ